MGIFLFGFQLLSQVIHCSDGDTIDFSSLATFERDEALENGLATIETSLNIDHNFLSDVSPIKGVIEQEDVENLKSLHIPVERLNVRISREPLRWISEQEKQSLLFEAYLAEIAYCAESEIASWSCGENTKQVGGVEMTKFFYNRDTTVQAYVARSDRRREIYVAFRGSVTLANWIYNLYVLKTTVIWEHAQGGKFRSPQVHEGFYLDYRSISQELVAHVLLLASQNPNYRIVVTGHSLGGALASLCAMELAELIDSGQEVYLTTFESPRVGDNTFVELSRHLFPPQTGRSIRVTHSHDVCVHLPSTDLGFIHIGQEYFIPSPQEGLPPRTAYACSPAQEEDPRCSYGYLGYSVDDHLFYPSTWNGIIFGTVGTRTS